MRQRPAAAEGGTTGRRPGRILPAQCRCGGGLLVGGPAHTGRLLVVSVLEIGAGGGLAALVIRHADLTRDVVTTPERRPRAPVCRPALFFDWRQLLSLQVYWRASLRSSGTHVGYDDARFARHRMLSTRHGHAIGGPGDGPVCCRM